MFSTTPLQRFAILLAISQYPLSAHAEVPLPRPVEVDDNPRHRLQQLDDQNGEFVVDALNGDELLKLTGRIRCLRITSVEGAAILDASELNAEEIIVTGSINGGPTIRLNAPRGHVDILGDVLGGAKLEVAAPGGTVTVGAVDRNSIGGGTRVSITALNLTLGGGANGGTNIDVKLSKGGSLKFARLEEGAHVTYHRASPDDPEPRIEPGEINGGASIREGDGNRLTFTQITPVPRDPAGQTDVLRGRDGPRPFHRDTPREPLPANPIDTPRGPAIATGLILLDGTRIAGQIISVDGPKLSYRPKAGEVQTIELSTVAVLVFRPLPESKRDAFDTDTVGLLLRSGDFLEGTDPSVRDGRISLSSAIFGLKSYNADQDVIAMVLHRPAKTVDRGSEPAPVFPPGTERPQ